MIWANTSLDFVEFGTKSKKEYEELNYAHLKALNTHVFGSPTP